MKTYLLLKKTFQNKKEEENKDKTDAKLTTTQQVEMAGSSSSVTDRRCHFVFMMQLKF